MEIVEVERGVYIFTLFLGIFLIYLGGSLLRAKCQIEKSLEGYLSYFLLPILFLLIGLLTFSLSFYEKSIEKQVVERKELWGVRSSFRIHSSGNMFYFVFQSSDNYIGWIKKNGGFMKHPMPSDSVVYEDNNESPHYEIRCILSRPILFSTHFKKISYTCENRIYVPKGGLKLEYNIK